MKAEDLLNALKEARLYLLDNAEYFETAKKTYAPFQKGIANENNFFINTVAIFDKIERRPKGQPNHVSINRFEGKISSEYWYTKDGVIRGSCHWGTEIASCDWALGKLTGRVNQTSKLYGFCSWAKFILKTEIIDGELASF